MLQLQNVTVAYETLPVVKNVTLNIPAGQLYGLIGPNGAGKSSLLKVCAGILRDYEGTVKFKEKDINDDHFWLKTQVGYAPEDVQLLPYLSGLEFLQMIGAIRQLENVDDEIKFLLNLLGLEKDAGQLIVNYSHGMRQKLSLAAALMGSPPLLLLDEAISGLDTLALYRLRDHLQKLTRNGRLIILASHILPLAKDWCDTLIIMHGGDILQQISREEVERLERESNTRFEEFFIKLVNR